MGGFPFGMIALIVASILIYFGLAHRVLDRLRLTDKTALAVLAAMIVGSFITVPLYSGPLTVAVNLGGAVIPVILAIYLLVKAGTSKEVLRTLAATAITGLSLFVSGRFLNGEPEAIMIDPLYVYPLIAGILAYLFGRTRRGAFVAAVLGVLLMDLLQLSATLYGGFPGTFVLGGGGMLDSVVFSGIVAVMLAEIIGESRERLQGGPREEGHDPELLKNLREPSFNVEAGEELTPREKAVKGEEHR